MIRVWRVDAGGFVAGHGSRDLIIEAGGTPMWSARQRAWSCAPRRLADVMALAEHNGWRVKWLGVKDGAA